MDDMSPIEQDICPAFKQEPTHSADGVSKIPALAWSRLSELFSSHLTEFMRKHRGVDIGAQGWKVPILAGKEVDLALLYHEVVSRGGEEKVTSAKQWKQVSTVVLGSEAAVKHTGTSTLISKHYGKFLRDYEARYLWGIQELPGQKIVARVSSPSPDMVDPSDQVEAAVQDRKPFLQSSNVVNVTRTLSNPGHTSFASLMSTQELPLELNIEHRQDQQPIDLEHDSRSEATQDDEPDAPSPIAPSPAACPVPELHKFPRPAPPLPRRGSRGRRPMGTRAAMLDRSGAGPSGTRRREGGRVERGLSEEQLAKLLKRVRAEAAKEAARAAMRAVQPIRAQMREMCASMEQMLVEHQQQLHQVKALKRRLERALQQQGSPTVPTDARAIPSALAAPLRRITVGAVAPSAPRPEQRCTSSSPRPSAGRGSPMPRAPGSMLLEAPETTEPLKEAGDHACVGVTALVPGLVPSDRGTALTQAPAATEPSHGATPARASPKRSTHPLAPPAGSDTPAERMLVTKEYLKSAAASQDKPAKVKSGANAASKFFNSSLMETGHAASGGGNKDPLRIGVGTGRMVPKKVPAPKPSHWSLPPAMMAEAPGGAQASLPVKKLAPRPQIGGVKRAAEDGSSAEHASPRRQKLRAAEFKVEDGNPVELGPDALKGIVGKLSMPPDELQHDVALLQRHRLCTFMEKIGEIEQRSRKGQEWEDLCFICKDGGEMVICEYGHNGDNDSQQHPGKRRSKLRAKRKCWHAVHKECLGLHKVPEGLWECNQHRCMVDDCDQPPAASCRLCPTSFCSMHTPADILAMESASSGDCATRQITCKSCTNILSMKPWDQVLRDNLGASKVSRAVYVSGLANLPSSKHLEKWQNTVERIRGKSPSEGTAIRKAVVAALGQAVGRTDVQSMLARSLSCYKSCNDACQTKTFALQTLERFRL